MLLNFFRHRNCGCTKQWCKGVVQQRPSDILRLDGCPATQRNLCALLSVGLFGKLCGKNKLNPAARLVLYTTSSCDKAAIKNLPFVAAFPPLVSFALPSKFCPATFAP